MYRIFLCKASFTAAKKPAFCADFSCLFKSDDFLFKPFHNFLFQSGYIGLRDSQQIGHFLLGHFLPVLVCKSMLGFRL